MCSSYSILSFFPSKADTTASGFCPCFVLRSLMRKRSIRSAARGWRRRGGSLPELAARELGYGRFDKSIEVRVGDAHRVDVGAGPEDYRFVFRQRLFHVDRQIVEIAEGRHGAEPAFSTSTWYEAGSASMTISPSAKTMTVLASIFPGTCSLAATSWAVTALGWCRTSKGTRSSRK